MPVIIQTTSPLQWQNHIDEKGGQKIFLRFGRFMNLDTGDKISLR